jgi:hypothetical protein
MKPSVISKIIEIIASVFILLFVYTATSKLIAHDTFLISLKKSPVISFASSFISWVIPLIEILISVFLLVPSFRKIGLMASLFLMTAFTIYIAYMLLTSSQLPCSCGGVIAMLSWKEHLWLNIFLTMLAATGIFINKRPKFLFE